MRILGSLCNWYKLAFLLTVTFSGLRLVYAEPDTIILHSYSDVLDKAKKYSLEYEKSKRQFQLDVLSSDNILSMYNWTLSGNIQKQDAESPPTSPFAPAGESSSTSSNLRLEKKTAIGLDPFVELSANDQALNFPGREAIEFQTAALEIGLRADLMKSFFAKSSSSIFLKEDLQRNLSKLAQEKVDRDFSFEVLKNLLIHIRDQKKTAILNTQCEEYKTLQRISASRFRRKLIRERDYLSIEALYQTCTLDKQSALNNSALSKISLLKIMGLPSKTKLILQIKNFPIPEKKNKVILAEGNSKKDSYEWASNYEYQIAQVTMKSSEAQALSLKFQKLPKLTLDYSLKSQTSEDGVGESLSESFNFDLLTHKVGLGFVYEFGQSSSNIAAEKSAMENKVQKLKFEDIKRSLNRDGERLKKNLMFLKKAYEASNDLTKIQKRKSNLFNRDFKNGRGSIRDLVEAQISYLGSLEKALGFEYSLALFQLNLHQLKGLEIDKIN